MMSIKYKVANSNPNFAFCGSVVYFIVIGNFYYKVWYLIGMVVLSRHFIGIIVPPVRVGTNRNCYYLVFVVQQVEYEDLNF